jgi:hypothetical protein
VCFGSASNLFEIVGFFLVINNYLLIKIFAFYGITIYGAKSHL